MAAISFLHVKLKRDADNISPVRLEHLSERYIKIHAIVDYFKRKKR